MWNTNKKKRSVAAARGDQGGRGDPMTTTSPTATGHPVAPSAPQTTLPHGQETGSLDALVAQVRELLDAPETSLCMSRRDTGCAIASYASANKLTDRQAIHAVLDRVDAREAVLYDALRLHRAFADRGAFLKLMKRRNREGRPLRYSMILLLARRVSTPLMRNNLADQALALSWRHNDLKQKVDELYPPSKGTTHPPSEATSEAAPEADLPDSPRPAVAPPSATSADGAQDGSLGRDEAPGQHTADLERPVPRVEEDVKVQAHGDEVAEPSNAMTPAAGEDPGGVADLEGDAAVVEQGARTVLPPVEVKAVAVGPTASDRAKRTEALVTLAKMVPGILAASAALMSQGLTEEELQAHQSELDSIEEASDCLAELLARLGRRHDRPSAGLLGQYSSHNSDTASAGGAS